MSNITPAFDGLLKQREASTTKKGFSLEQLDEFLKEAYRINSHISLLHTQLKDVRQAYLSTAPTRKSQLHSKLKPHQKALTDREREEVDANAKKMLRELNASIRTLADAEQLRHETELALIRKKHSSGLGMLGSWASGGKSGAGGMLGGKKSKEHEVAEAREAQMAGHRDGVLHFLRQRLQQCVETQQSMMEVRLTREVEKSRSVLAKARPGHMHAGATGAPPSFGAGLGDRGMDDPTLSGTSFIPLQDEEKRRGPPPPDLTEEEVQMFEKGSQDMMKYYESTLEKVMSAEKSLLEISELQTMLVNNLATQSAGIEQLVQDSMNTEENVGGGNKQLKEATQRASTAKYTFFAASGLCAFLVIWDLLI
ncbi:hypothetical protein PspLS_06798 [Pyricularia sp. CBS 133598]|nr:hypothetical protein PspLS_06798 [Pyricularia sp. CBS 133598]